MRTDKNNNFHSGSLLCWLCGGMEKAPVSVRFNQDPGVGGSLGRQLQFYGQKNNNLSIDGGEVSTNLGVMYFKHSLVSF